MKTKINKIGLLLVLLLVIQSGNAQTSDFLNPSKQSSTYKTAVGIRAGEIGALTIKGFVTQGTAIEGIIGFWNHGFNTTLLFEKHVPAFSVDGLNWYYGLGGHASFYNGKYWAKERPARYRYYNDGEIGLGVDGVIGIEYAIPQIPFAISLDAIPYVEAVTNGDIWVSINPGLGIKLTF